MDIPKEVQSIIGQLQEHGFEAYVVGGCVRDILLKLEPQDWDIATNATPEQIQEIFPRNFYENRFFTVTVLTESEHPKLKEIEITTFRAELNYTDRRRPGEVQFAKTIEEDVSRRDFTINAIALRLVSLAQGKPFGQAQGKPEIVDPYNGQKDLAKKVIRAVGNPKERFAEDALRMMRAVRFVATLGFSIDPETKAAIKENSAFLKEISQERVRDELAKIIMGKEAIAAIEQLRELGLLRYIIPELEEGYGVTQNKHHIYTVWEHNLYSLQYAIKKNFSFEVRLAALLHDVGKPRTKRGEGPNSTFYGHQVVGVKIAKHVLERLKFPKEVQEKITLLIREHMFVYDPEGVTLKGVRRLLSRVGIERMEELFQLREADRIGSGVPKAQPYRLRHLKAMVEKVHTDPVSAKMLKLNGNELMEKLGITPGPQVGALLSILLEEVLDDPEKNTKQALLKRAKELHELPTEELQKLAKQAKMSAEAAQGRIDSEIKRKYFVE